MENELDMQTCIYCLEKKPISKFSLEHIFPDALGGALCSDLFKTRHVCQRCNALCGLYIDGFFIKNWFSQNYKAENAFKYIDLEKGCFLPLTYMGVLENQIPTQAGEVCDVWLGPCGDQIYHFHKVPKDNYFEAYAGGDPRISKQYGCVYLFATTDHQKWQLIVLLSFLEHFKKSKTRRISGNIDIVDETTRSLFFHQATDEENAYLDKLKSVVLKNETHRLKLVIQKGFEERFLAKVALGVGFNILGENYLKTPYSKILRNTLWEQDHQKRSSLGMIYKGLFGSKETLETLLKNFICWEGGHSIFLKIIESQLILSLCVFGKMFLSVVVADSPELYSTELLQTYQEGQIYILIPQRKKFCGLIPFPNYLAHKKNDRKIQALSEIESWVVDISTLPPFRSENYPK